MRSWMMAAVLGLTAALGTVEAGTIYQVDTKHSDVTFNIKHLVGKVQGRFTDFSGKIDSDPKTPSVEFTIKATSIDTAEPKRDGHLRSADFFDVEKYPEITFKSEKVVPKGKDEFEVEGTLTMHGVSKPITLPVSVSGPMADPWGKQRAGFEIKTSLNRKDFGIVWNKTLDNGGVMLGDDVLITINLEAVQEAPAAPAAAASAATAAPAAPAKTDKKK